MGLILAAACLYLPRPRLTEIRTVVDAMLLKLSGVSTSPPLPRLVPLAESCFEDAVVRSPGCEVQRLQVSHWLRLQLPEHSFARIQEIRHMPFVLAPRSA